MASSNIYDDMVKHITKELANETKIKIKDECCRDVDMVLMKKEVAEKHLEAFKNEVLSNQHSYKNICDLFEYNPANGAEVKPIDPKLISATTYNDYYKFTMAPVIGAVEDHQEKKIEKYT